MVSFLSSKFHSTDLAIGLVYTHTEKWVHCTCFKEAVFAFEELLD